MGEPNEIDVLKAKYIEKVKSDSIYYYIDIIICFCYNMHKMVG